MKLVVVSQNGCNPCTAVKNFLNGEGVEFEEFNIHQKDSIKIEGKEMTRIDLDVMSTPVVILFDGEEEVARAGKDIGDIEVLISQM